MAKLTPAQARVLRIIRDGDESGRAIVGNRRTLDALRARFAVRPLRMDGDSVKCWTLTPTGRTLLDEHERAEREAKAGLERASRPVPAGAFTEPSARTAPVLGLEYDEDEPVTVPDANVDQLVKLLQHGARIVLDGERWTTGVNMAWIHADRLDEAAKEAIRRGIARALPPTHNGTVRLALWRHAYKAGYSGMSCDALLLAKDADGREYGESCGLPAGHPVHKV